MHNFLTAKDIPHLVRTFHPSLPHLQHLFLTNDHERKLSPKPLASKWIATLEKYLIACDDKETWLDWRDKNWKFVLYSKAATDTQEAIARMESRKTVVEKARALREKELPGLEHDE